MAIHGEAFARDCRGEDFRVMTYNIRLNLASDGENDWPHRQPLVAALIRHEAPDVLGMQEVLLIQKRDLERDLPNYAMVGVGRDDGEEKGEFSPIAYRRDRFRLIDQGTIWLSQTPSLPSKGWDAAYPRIATWALLRDWKSKITLRVVNTHFDHVGATARQQSASLIAQWLNKGEWARLPTVVMGDLNSPPGSAAYNTLAEDPRLALGDARLLTQTPAYGPPGTFNDFKIGGISETPIDHIFVSKSIGVSSYAVVTQHWGGRLPSDHYPVVAEMTQACR